MSASTAVVSVNNQEAPNRYDGLAAFNIFQTMILCERLFEKKTLLTEDPMRIIQTYVLLDTIARVGVLTKDMEKLKKKEKLDSWCLNEEVDELLPKQIFFKNIPKIYNNARWMCSKQLDEALRLSKIPEFHDIIDRFINEDLVDPNEVLPMGHTPIARAAEMSVDDILGKFLSLLQTDINKKNRNGNTALHEAARQSVILPFHMLLEVDGIDLHAKNKDNQTALQIVDNLRLPGGQYCVMYDLLRDKIKAKERENIQPAKPASNSM